MNTIEEIYDWMILNKTSFGTLTGLTGLSDYQSFLTNLTSDSKTANWNLEIYNQAVVIKLIIDKIEEERNNIQTIKDSGQVMSAEWYRNKVLDFQYGDIVQVINYVPNYTEIDTEKQIVEFCSVEETDDLVLLKVRRKDGTTLSVDELLGLESYLEDIKGIGTDISVINEEPDSIKFYYNIIYSPQVNLDDLKDEVELVIENYIQNLPFDSIIYINEMTDLLQEIDGVIDPRGEKISAKIDSQSTYIDYTWSYNLIAGYGVLEDIENTITYSVE